MQKFERKKENLEKMTIRYLDEEQTAHEKMHEKGKAKKAPSKQRYMDRSFISINEYFYLSHLLKELLSLERE